MPLVHHAVLHPIESADPLEALHGDASCDFIFLGKLRVDHEVDLELDQPFGRVGISLIRRRGVQGGTMIMHW